MTIPYNTTPSAVENEGGLSRSGQNTVYTIQAFRGIAVILVVLYHATQFFTAHYQVAPFGGLFLFGFSGVHIFFVLSGFIIYMVHRDDIGKPGRYFSYIKKRFIRIYPTYWAILAILSSYFLFRGTIVVHDIYQNLDLIHAPQNLINPICWTLFFEILFYAVFSFLILNRILGSFLMLCWVLGVGATHLFSMQIPFVSPLLLHKYSVLFMIGMIMSYVVMHLKHLSPRVKNILAPAAGLGGLLVFSLTAIYCLIYEITNWDTWIITLGFGFSSGMFMVCSLSDALEQFFKRQKILTSVGNASYSIYLLHYFLVERVVANLKLHFSTNSLVSVSLAFVAVSTLIVLAGCLFYWKVERPLLGFMRRRIL